MPYDTASYILGQRAAGGGGSSVTVEALDVTENGEYTAETDKAYSPVNVAVPQTTVEPLSVTENNTYTAPPGKAYTPVTVNVPNSYSAGDEGKVVSNGALVAQTAHAEVTSNGTIDTTLNNSVTVNVSGGVDKAYEKDVNFIDYDGTIVYSYTAAQAQALTALPANPSHSGLTAEGWNWTLAQIKAQLTAVPGGPIWVGQQYVTTSGATEIDIRLASDTLSPYLILGVNGTSNINWGDGLSDSLSGSSINTSQYIQHTYANPGNYTISISGGQYRFNGVSGKSGVLSYQAGHTTSFMYSNCVLAIRGGVASEFKGLTGYSLKNCTSMRYITIPSTCSGFAEGAFGECYALHAIVLPNAYTGGSYARFYRSLQRISLAAGWTTFGTQSIQQCESLQSITIPTGTTVIGDKAFSEGKSLRKMYIPGTVTSIGANAFNNCYSMNEYHLFPTSPPTLGGTNAFNNIPSWCKIYVPYSADHSILASYQSASNWSTYASYMQEEPQ